MAAQELVQTSNLLLVNDREIGSGHKPKAVAPAEANCRSKHMSP
jgi:hypothetical protein